MSRLPAPGSRLSCPPDSNASSRLVGQGAALPCARRPVRSINSPSSPDNPEAQSPSPSLGTMKTQSTEQPGAGVWRLVVPRRRMLGIPDRTVSTTSSPNPTNRPSRRDALNLVRTVPGRRVSKTLCRVRTAPRGKRSGKAVSGPGERHGERPSPGPRGDALCCVPPPPPRLLLLPLLPLLPLPLLLPLLLLPVLLLLP